MNRELVIGMKLTVREDLNVDLECPSFVATDMLEFAGKEVTVSCINDIGNFYIEEDGLAWVWDKEMFKEFIEESI